MDARLTAAVEAVQRCIASGGSEGLAEALAPLLEEPRLAAIVERHRGARLEPLLSELLEELRRGAAPPGRAGAEPTAPATPSTGRPVKKGKRPSPLTALPPKPAAGCPELAGLRRSPGTPASLGYASSAPSSAQSPAPWLASEGSQHSGGEGLQVEGPEDLELEGKLGQGSSSVVERHRHLRSGRLVAVKVIQATDLEERLRKQILLEVRTFRECRSPHIVDYYGAFFYQNKIHVALEYMNAGALSTLLTKRRTIPESYLAAITLQVCDGLEYLHGEMNVIHRDVKPANLLLTTAGVVKITDFGVSGELDLDMGQSNKSTWVGTIYYMSPERIRGEKYSFDSDMWSLGLSLIECISGCFPYLDRSVAEGQHKLSMWDLMHRIDTEEPPQLDAGSVQLHDFLRALLQKEPPLRQSAAIMRAHPWLATAPARSDLAAWIVESVESPDSFPKPRPLDSEGDAPDPLAQLRGKSHELPVESPARAATGAMARVSRGGENPFRQSSRDP